jgi:hypothetical protein
LVDSSIPSNVKYIDPLNTVYYERLTKMMNYPGYDNLYTEQANKLFNPREPDIAKAYLINENKNPSVPVISQNGVKKECNGCKSMP